MIKLFNVVKNALGRAVGLKPLNKWIDMISPEETRLNWEYVVALLIRLVFVLILLWVAQFFGVPVDKIVELLRQVISITTGGA